jgi:hypothetical protein
MRPYLGDDQMVGFIRFGNDFTQNFYLREILKGDCAFSIIDIRLFSFDCTGSVASRNEIDLLLALSIEKIMAMSVDLSTLPLGFII